MKPKRIAAAIAIVAFFLITLFLTIGCATPQKLGPMPSVAPVKESNAQTRKSIKESQTHSEKGQVILKEQAHSIDTVISDLDQLRTPTEHVIVQHAKDNAQKARQENIDAWAEARSAYDTAYQADQHAAETEKITIMLARQLTTYQNKAEAIVKERDSMKDVYDQVTRWWGLGAFVWGFKQLLKHLLILSIVAVVLVGAIWALSFAFPVFGIAFSWLMSMIKKLLNMLRK